VQPCKRLGSNTRFSAVVAAALVDFFLGHTRDASAEEATRAIRPR
jgi:hypothetical protein